MNDKRFLTVAEMANLLGIGLNNAYALIRLPGFPAVRVSPKRIVISAQGLDEWVKRGGV